MNIGVGAGRGDKLLHIISASRVAVTMWRERAHCRAWMRTDRAHIWATSSCIVEKSSSNASLSSPRAVPFETQLQADTARQQ
jgi:hypothetical protein